MNRTHGYDLLYSLLAFICEEDLTTRLDLASPVMAAFNLIAEHHVPDRLLGDASGLGAAEALDRANTVAFALAMSADGLEEKLRLLRTGALINDAQRRLASTSQGKP